MAQVIINDRAVVLVIDTTVLVRRLVDDPGATEPIRRRAEASRRGRPSDIAPWHSHRDCVAAQKYGVPKSTIVDPLVTVVQSTTFVLHREEVFGLPSPNLADSRHPTM